MGACLIPLLTLAPLLATATVTHAHIGDQVYFFYELLDEDLDRIDLTDGSVEDWIEVIGEPSLTASDFVWEDLPYDPSGFDFRIWIAWHQGSGTLWIAMERFDDLYVNLYDGVEPWEMQLWDSSLRFAVDGDHTGGGFSYFLGRYCEDCTAEQVLEDQRQAQQWMAIAEAPDGAHLFHFGASEWVIREPYSSGGGGVIGESPATTVTEFMVTPFDDLVYNDENASEVSRLYSGKIIGFEMVTYENDDARYEDGLDGWARLSLTGDTRALVNADFFRDGLLVGVGEEPVIDDVSGVESSSWARIKASFK